MHLIKPVQKNGELLTDILSFESENHFKLWCMGQSGFLIKWQQKYTLLDPYLSDSLTLKYQNTDKPHVRMSEQVIDPGQLKFVDIVTSSHNHTDHLDADTLVPILKDNADIKFVIPEANRSFVANRLSCAPGFPIGLNEGTVYTHAGFKITGVPAAHNLVERNEKGECLFMGFIVQFGNFSVYHSGDTLWFDGLEETLIPYKLDVALLPINGSKPERKVAGNLSAEEAALLAKAIGAKLVIPHHFHLFEFNTEDPEVFEEQCLKHHVNYRVLKMGEGVVI